MLDVAKLIPHRAPWALVDRVVSIDGDVVTAERRVVAGDPLVGGLGLGGPMLVEALAQTAACLMGARRAAEAGGDGAAGHRGYLVALRGFRFEGRAAPGETVTLVARKVSGLGSVHGFDGVARVGDRVLAAGGMTFAVVFDEA